MPGIALQGDNVVLQRLSASWRAPALARHLSALGALATATTAAAGTDTAEQQQQQQQQQQQAAATEQQARLQALMEAAELGAYCLARARAVDWDAVASSSAGPGGGGGGGAVSGGAALGIAAAQRASDGIAAALADVRQALPALIADSVRGAAVAPVREEVGRLVAELAEARGERRGGAGVAARTTLKGAQFEAEVVARLAEWRHRLGSAGGGGGAGFGGAALVVEHVGADNRAGDVALRWEHCDELGGGGGGGGGSGGGAAGGGGGNAATTEDLSVGCALVVEAKDMSSPLSRRRVMESLERAALARGAAGAVLVSRTAHGLSHEMGEWEDGLLRGGQPYVVCTFEHVATAARFVLARQRLAWLARSGVGGSGGGAGGAAGGGADGDGSGVDAEAAEAALRRARGAAARFTTLKRRVTEVRNAAGAIETEAAAIAEGIAEALDDAERELAARHGGRKQN